MKNVSLKSMLNELVERFDSVEDMLSSLDEEIIKHEQNTEKKDYIEFLKKFRAGIKGYQKTMGEDNV